ncbi:MAG: hypothetical protein KBA97_09680 [Methanothrix sp.]|nr:hypothetical protein [Methanothrix sp.]
MPTATPTAMLKIKPKVAPKTMLNSTSSITLEKAYFSMPTPMPMYMPFDMKKAATTKMMTAVKMPMLLATA